jgi:Asp-tRNA(Asn)/Glu-tRNA(Gln) amidotransferase A subunit family amidase
MTAELDVVGALIAGFAGTVVMSLLMNGAKAAGMTNMPPMPLVAGSMMSGDRMTRSAWSWVTLFRPRRRPRLPMDHARTPRTPSGGA